MSEEIKDMWNIKNLLPGDYLKGEDSQLVEEEKKAERVARISKYKNSGFPEKFNGVQLDELNEKQKETANLFLEKTRSGKSSSLWLCGYAGTGKTCLASAIAKETALDGKNVKYIKSHLLIEKLKKNQIPIDNVLYELKSNSLVVIDEVGRYPVPEWESYYLFLIMDELYNLGISVIMISNMDKEKLGGLLGNACVDRFRGLAKSVEFTGKSYRGTDNELYVA